MKNCEGSPTKLRSSIENIVNHYQVQHCVYRILILFLITVLYRENVHCVMKIHYAEAVVNYSPLKLELKDKNAITAYSKKLKETLIYVNAESYCRVSFAWMCVVIVVYLCLI